MSGSTGIGKTYHTMKERSTTPSTPGATYDRLFFKSDGLHYVNSGGADVMVAGTTNMTTITDPAGTPTFAAVTTAIVNAYSGVVITTTTTGNAQTIQSPTVVTAGKIFTVVNNDTSTHSIAVNGIVITAGEAQSFIWDGTAWGPISIGITAIPVPINQGGTGQVTAGAAMNALGVPSATAESDFIASGASPFAWAKKTLAEVKTILGLVLTQAAETVGFTLSGGTTPKTLTVSNTASVAGTNTGDVTLATDHGLGLTNQVLNMGTPSSITGASTNAVSTTTHTHALDLTAPPAIGGTTPATAQFSPLKAKGPAIITSFSGTISRSGTTLTFSQTADAILAGYSATNPVLGATVIHPTGPVTMNILAWLSNATATVDSTGSLSAETPTSVQLPISFDVDSSGVLKSAVLANGNIYVAGSVGGLTLAPQTTGFTIAGGITAKTLTISGDVTISGALGSAAYTASTAYEASGAVSSHAALLTGVHGLSITAGKVLTVQDNVTITGALGTAAYTAATAYDASGAATSAVSGHASLTTGVHGLTAQTNGFTITSGTTPKTLTVPLDASVSGTNTGDQTLSGLNAMQAGSQSITPTGSTYAIDWANGATAYTTLNDVGATVTFANPVAGTVYRIVITQGAGGSKTVTTWPTISWAGGSAPTLTATAGQADIVTLLYANSKYYGDCRANF